MEIYDCGGEVKITGISDFDLSKTFECGQCFRWNADENGAYAGIAYGSAARVRRDGDNVCISGSVHEFNDLWRSYFDLDRDYAQIRKQLVISPFMKCASEFGAGIRILRQEPWEALCSFILSQNNNIPRIKKNIEVLCRDFGNSVAFGGKVFYTFPSAEALCRLTEADLSPLRCGYRARYIIEAAKAVAGGHLNLDALAALPENEARAALMALCGVGSKVADCVLLYGLHMTDSFPVDVWIKRALEEHFPPDFNPGVFSPYAGIAQQYIFHYTRNTKS